MSCFFFKKDDEWTADNDKLKHIQTLKNKKMDVYLKELPEYDFAMVYGSVPFHQKQHSNTNSIVDFGKIITYQF